MKLLPAAFLGALAAAAGAADPPPELLLDALTENLLKNAGPDLPSMDGWDDVVSGGDGAAPREVYRGPRRRPRRRRRRAGRWRRDGRGPAGGNRPLA